MAQAVAILTGEEAPGMAPDAMGAEPTAMGADEFPSGDEFTAADASAGGAEAAGREMRENIAYSRKLGTMLSQPKKK